jgi:hypothetical protein
MCCLSCFIIFWTTKYNTPRTFCLANYSVVFHDRCICLLPHISTNHSNCIRTLECNPSNQYTTFSYTCWQVGFVLRSAPPVTLCPPVLPSREHKQTFFPTHLLYSYNHRFCQWSHPCGCKRGSVGDYRFGHITMLILMRLSPHIFQNLNIVEYTTLYASLNSFTIDYCLLLRLHNASRRLLCL